MTTVEVAIPWRTDGDGWRETAHDWCTARWLELFPDWKIVEADDGVEEGEFNIARALNRVVEASSADVLVVTGADTILSSRAVEEAVAQIESGRVEWVMACDTMHRLDRLDTETVLQMDPAGEIPVLGRRVVAQLGWGPIIASRSRLLERLWDERMVAGGEDDVFGVAAQSLWGPPGRSVRSAAVMLWHPRIQRSKHPEREACVALRNNYVANRWEPAKIRQMSRAWQ